MNSKKLKVYAPGERELETLIIQENFPRLFGRKNKTRREGKLSVHLAYVRFNNGSSEN